MTVTTRSRFWGPLFPDVWDEPGRVFWGPLFPDPGPSLDLVQPTGPAGVATFVVDLDATLDLVLEWQTDVFKANDGTERRAAVLDSPRHRYTGSALLIGGDSVRTLRSQLARHAAAGATFLLGLPFEAMLLAADASGNTVTVPASALASCDWANPGQRVVIVSKDRQARDAVIQSASGVTITLDISPGALGDAGGTIMPTVPIFLDAQQAFARYVNPDGIERWAIKATGALFGFQKQAVAALLDIEAAYPAAGNLVGLIIQARVPGVDGNDIRVAFADDSLSGVDVEEVGDDVTVRFVPGVTTVGEIAAAINASSSLVRCVGAWNEDFIAGDGSSDTFALTSLDGGSDGDYVTEGVGASIATHATRPVYDAGLVVESTSGDSMQAMNEIVELGGLPANIGPAARPDWGRQIATKGRIGSAWQWIKRFCATVRGRQRAFWLPTYRRDLKPSATGVGTLTIDTASDADGGFAAWYPTRSDIQILQADGTITRATITNAVDNGDGTTTLTIGTTLSGSPITMVSWLELCRFEDDAITVRFQGHMLAMSTTARVVTQ